MEGITFETDASRASTAKSVGAALGDVPPDRRLEETWRNMPETSLVQASAARARPWEMEMIDRSVVKEGMEDALEAERAIEPGGNLRSSWEALLKNARKCVRCDLTITQLRPCSERGR